MKGIELYANIIWLPSTCDNLGGNYIIVLLLTLALGWYQTRQRRLCQNA